MPECCCVHGWLHAGMLMIWWCMFNTITTQDKSNWHRLWGKVQTVSLASSSLTELGKGKPTPRLSDPCMIVTCVTQWSSRASSLAGRMTVSVVPSPVCPQLPLPQLKTLPCRQITIVCSPPQTTCISYTSSFRTPSGHVFTCVHSAHAKQTLDIDYAREAQTGAHPHRHECQPLSRHVLI